MDCKLAMTALALLAGLFVTGSSISDVLADDKTEEEVEAKIDKKYEERITECEGDQSAKCIHIFQKCEEYIAKNDQQGGPGC